MTGFTRLPSSTSTGNTNSISPGANRHRLSRYGPLVLGAALIFLGSSSALSAPNTSVLLRPLVWLFPYISEETLHLIHFLVRKGGHFTEYAILALLAARAFKSSSREFLRNHWFLASLLLVVLYSLSDEFHQSFVPSRTPSMYDSMIDTLGGLTALVMLIMPKPPKATVPSQRSRFKG